MDNEIERIKREMKKKKGKINVKQLSSKKILYDIDSFEDFQPKQKQNIIYARVSNTKQADDLSKQLKD